MFVLCTRWRDPHITHRNGYTADIRANPDHRPSTALPRQNFRKSSRHIETMPALRCTAEELLISRSCRFQQEPGWL